MQTICILFASKLGHKLVKNASGTVSHRLLARNSSRAGATNVIQYFTTFPLFSSKWLDYLNWIAVHEMVMSGEAKTPSGNEKVLAFKANHNKNYSYLDTFKNFYRR